MSTAMTHRFGLSESMVGLRPRADLLFSPSRTHPLAISSSTMRETVLGWRPDLRERSARESGCWRRMMSSRTFVFMRRGVRLDATGDLEDSGAFIGRFYPAKQLLVSRNGLYVTIAGFGAARQGHVTQQGGPLVMRTGLAFERRLRRRSGHCYGCRAACGQPLRHARVEIWRAGFPVCAS